MSRPDDSAEHFTIRVSADNQSQGQVAIRGAVYGSGTRTVQVIDGMTPFELETRGPVLSGMVQAIDPSAPVRVEVFSTDGDVVARCIMGARGRTVLLGEKLSQGRFIRTAD